MEEGKLKKDDIWEIALELLAHAHGYVMLYRAGRFNLSQTDFRKSRTAIDDEVIRWTQGLTRAPCRSPSRPRRFQARPLSQQRIVPAVVGNLAGCLAGIVGRATASLGRRLKHRAARRTDWRAEHVGLSWTAAIPVMAALGSVIVPAVVFCIGVVLFRMLLRRGQFWLAVLAFPSVTVAYEYLISLGFGTFGATGYTQLENLPVLQLGCRDGALGHRLRRDVIPLDDCGDDPEPDKSATAADHRLCRGFWVHAQLWFVAVSITPRAPHQIVAGLIASDLPKNVLPQNDQDAMRLLRDYVEQVKFLSQHGAKVVVLPEMTALVRDSISGEVDDLFRQAARHTKAQVLLGVLHATSNGTFNEARLYSEAGTPDVVYRKHHLVPVLEGRTTPGSDISVVRESIGTVGLEICRDMDYPDPSRRYGRAQAGLVLAPAWDFDIDRFWHGHMAILRGVESGFTVVRAAKQGLLTVSDNRGRVLSERRTTPREPFTTMVATVPVHHETTLYQSWGDWFAWLNIAFVAGLFIRIVTKAAKRAPTHSAVRGERQRCRHRGRSRSHTTITFADLS